MKFLALAFLVLTACGKQVEQGQSNDPGVFRVWASSNGSGEIVDLSSYTVPYTKHLEPDPAGCTFDMVLTGTPRDITWTMVDTTTDPALVCNVYNEVHFRIEGNTLVRCINGVCDNFN